MRSIIELEWARESPSTTFALDPYPHLGVGARGSGRTDHAVTILARKSSSQAATFRRRRREPLVTLMIGIAREQGVALETQYEPDLPSLMIDERYVKQMLLNVSIR